MYDNILTSYGISPNDNMKIGRQSKEEYQMVYPIPYPFSYPVDNPVQYSNVKYPISRLYEDVIGPPYPHIDKTSIHR